MKLRRFFSQAAVLLLTGSLVACGGGTANVSGQVLVQWQKGVLGLEGAKGHGGMDCFTSGGFDDLKEGAEVLVLNEEGNPIGKGKLGKGATSDEEINVCVFPFEITDVKLKGDLFKMKISHRDGPTFDRTEIQEPLTLSLL